MKGKKEKKRKKEKKNATDTWMDGWMDGSLFLFLFLFLFFSFLLYTVTAEPIEGRERERKIKLAYFAPLGSSIRAALAARAEGGRVN